MSPMRILTVVGARPQFVKASAVSRALAEAGAAETLVHTGQHFDSGMSEVFFAELGLPEPHLNLGIHGGGHGAMTGRMLMALEEVIGREAPDWVLVYGDTNSTLAGVLAAVKLRVPVAHVEAGLRSFNRAMPEEINRIVADEFSRLLFCPTQAAVRNLAREGITAGVHHVGDVMLDVARQLAETARVSSTILERLGVEKGRFALATVHRAENTDDRERLREILAYLKARAQDDPVVLPLHPRTRQAVEEAGLSLDGLMVIAPVGPLDMARLLDGCTVVLTDSGGLQKEAYFHEKPCVTLREETEWTETVEAGWNRLWRGPDYRPRRPIPDYGDGSAARLIARLLTGGRA
ncbi:non-hydrolyzing UDP-N-acetylglucosamine 2-epimerase [Azospirillum sp. sgz302134]